MKGPPAALERPGEVERLARLHRRWEWSRFGRRWYDHWRPAQAAFVQAVLPLVAALPLDGALLGLPRSLLPTVWLEGFSGRGLLVAWAVVLVGNAFLVARVLRWKGAMPRGSAARTGAVALAALPWVGLGFLARRRPVDVPPSPRVPRRPAGAFQLRLPDRLGAAVDRLVGAVEEPLAAVLWLLVVNSWLFLATCQWVADHAGTPVQLLVTGLLHAVAAAALFLEGTRPWRHELAERLPLALLVFLPVPLAFAPFLVLGLRRGGVQRWTLCGEALTSLGSMSRVAAWQSLRRGLRRQWRSTPWWLRANLGGPRSQGGRWAKAVTSLARLKTAALGFEGVLLGGLGASAGLELGGLWWAAVGLLVLAGAWWLAWLLRRLAERVRLLPHRPAPPAAGFALASTAFFAWGLAVGQERVATGDPQEVMGVVTLGLMLTLVLLGFGLLLRPVLHGTTARVEMKPLALWGLFLFLLLTACALSTRTPELARRGLHGLWVLAVVAPVWDLAAGLALGRWILRHRQPGGSTSRAAGPVLPGWRGRLRRGLAVLALLPGGGLVLPVWWGWTVAGEEAGDGT